MLTGHFETEIGQNDNIRHRSVTISVNLPFADATISHFARTRDITALPS
jgi:hypothetical protein